MKNHIIFLVTDSNRANIEVGYCTNITHKMLEIQQGENNPFSYMTKFNRIVYKEEFTTFEEAQKRRLELMQYTRMMKERIIRKTNPNWLNIGNSIPETNTTFLNYTYQQ